MQRVAVRKCGKLNGGIRRVRDVVVNAMEQLLIDERKQRFELTGKETEERRKRR